MSNIKKRHVFRGIVGIIMIFFVMTYIVSMSGYYEYSLNKEHDLTEESIKQFEEDVREGKDIDLNDYKTKESIDYSTKLTNTTTKVSLEVNDYIRDIIKGVFRHMNKTING